MSPMRPVMLDEYLKPFLPFLNDNSLTEIAVNRPGELFTECAQGWKRYEVPELTFDHCEHFAKLVASYNSREIGRSNPILSGTLPDGQRIQVIIPPCAEPGTVSITIRKPSLKTFTIDELEAGGAFDSFDIATKSLKPYEIELLSLLKAHKIKEFLILAVKSGLNIVFAGQTGSGKTTVMKTLCEWIPLNERLISIEDVREIILKHQNRVHLLYGRETGGGISAKQVLEACLRMKPDRILLAELRGNEAWEYLKSIGTDHSGITTMHSGGAYEAFPQLASLIKDSPTGNHLDSKYLMDRLYSTIDVVLYYKNRKLREVYYEPERKLSYLL